MDYSQSNIFLLYSFILQFSTLFHNYLKISCIYFKLTVKFSYRPILDGETDGNHKTPIH